MNFPNSWHIFLDDYSFKDKQKIYTNGTNLIPTFRVEQLIEHYFNVPLRNKAKWILSSFQDEEDNMNGNYHYECSNCGAEDVHSEHVHVPYCWHCGAKIDNERRDEDATD